MFDFFRRLLSKREGPHAARTPMEKPTSCPKERIIELLKRDDLSSDESTELSRLLDGEGGTVVILDDNKG